MLDYCMCPRCERMIMLDSDFNTGFCLYCGTHISYRESRDFLLEGLRSSVPDDLIIETDLCELIDEDDALEDTYGIEECREECAKAQEFMGKWDFANAFNSYTLAIEWCPRDFEACCGRLTAGILKLNDVENWESRLNSCLELIRSQSDWNMAQKSLEYSLDILQKFLAKGGRFVSPSYTFGFFRQLCESFPSLREKAAVIFAHCVNVDNAPFTDAARLDHETTRFAVGNYPAEPDKHLSRFMLLIMSHHTDSRKKHSLIRALYVFDRVIWLRNRDSERIDDVLDFLDGMFSGSYTTDDRKAALDAGYDLLMMGTLEPGSTQREKLKFLSGIYSWEQIKRMEKYFSGSAFFYRVYLEIYLKQKGATPISAEYRRVDARIRELTK